MGADMFESKTIRIAEFVFKNYQKFSETEIINELKITQNDFDRFRQVFGSDYAEPMDVKGKKIFRLTSKGAQLYLDLKGKDQQAFFNKVLSIATAVLATFSIIQTLKLYNII